jgi:ectoine hydroxylase-related dioxygenase (phytanoyl-CoA dioxygenase family)
MSNEIIERRNVEIATAKSLGMPPLDFKAMHEIVLPQRLRRGVSERIAWDLLDAAPMALQLPDGTAFSYVCDAGRVRIVPGVVDGATLVIELSNDSWTNYFYELRTRFGLLYSQVVRFVRGNFALWDVWEPALRCLYSGTPIYDPKTLDLRGLDGSPLDVRKSFRRDDDPRLISHFLRAAGYVHVRNVFSAEEIQRWSDEVDRLRDQSVEGTRYSRWAADGRGEKKVWDLQYMALQSAMMKDLDAHPMVRYLTGLAQEDVEPSVDRDNGTHAILREFTGVNDVGSNYMLDWHRDCGIGGCPITCPRVHVGIQLDAATPDSSQLFFLAGSAGRMAHDRFAENDWDSRPIVTFETAPGDVTVHLGCMLHAAPKATGRNRRRTIYTRWVNPRGRQILGRLGSIDQIIPNIDQMPSVANMAAEVESAY